MKVSREQVEANRARILEEAGKLFRERGFDGVGVSDIMKAAGLTHGAFYGHFDSKEHLVAAACSGPPGSTRGFRSGLAAHGTELEPLVQSYLSPRHRDMPANGCLYAALTGEVGRQSPIVRQAFTARIRLSIDHLIHALRGRSEAKRRQKALATLAGLVGALTLARAIDDAELSDEILRATAAELVE